MSEYIGPPAHAGVDGRPDEYHVFKGYDGRTHFLAPDGTFVPDLDRARLFLKLDEAYAAVEELVARGQFTEGDEPGVAFNAWRQHRPRRGAH